LSNPLKSLPDGFRYRSAFLHGRPCHTAFDAFSLKHPPMDTERRAKIFAPFDALRGFSDAISEKEIQYESFREMDEDRLADLNRKIALLLPLVHDGNAARKNQVSLRITFFCPCANPGLGEEGIFGQYRTVEGTLKKIDPVRGQLLLDDRLIDLDDIYEILDPEGARFAESDSLQDWDD